jgi:rhodanese-related sulfurtransferase
MSTPIERNEVQALLGAGAIVLIDAQGPGKFEDRHIPGAVRASADDAGAVLAAIGPDLDRAVVTYCTDEACTGSAHAAALLEAAGYRNVRRYVGGAADWEASGLPVERS